MYALPNYAICLDAVVPELFAYNTKKEAIAGYKRLCKSAQESTLTDGITRGIYFDEENSKKFLSVDYFETSR